jgi:hypothetical protein
MNEPLLEVKDINVEYRLREKVVKAVQRYKSKNK